VGGLQLPQIFYQNVQQYRDDICYLTGKHSFKAGISICTLRTPATSSQNVRGTIQRLPGHRR
jgi:hypothetical protein